MVRKILQKLRFYGRINIFQYFYLNYFCKRVVRMDRSRVIPYKGTVIDIALGAKLVLSNGDMEIGYNLLKGSKAETRVRLREGAVWNSDGGCQIFYGTTVEVLTDAFFESGHFAINTNSVIVVSKKIHVGNDVMMGRNVLIYDSDHHAIRNLEGKVTNPDMPIFIGDHVWLATNVMVMKGSNIGDGSIVGANSNVRGVVPQKSLFGAGKIRENYGTWGWDHP
jgi:acetyltransferase-like isoleucine patch superfamily enzyme